MMAKIKAIHPVRPSLLLGSPQIIYNMQYDDDDDDDDGDDDDDDDDVISPFSASPACLQFLNALLRTYAFKFPHHPSSGLFRLFSRP